MTDDDTFAAPALGFRITRPAGWHFGTSAWHRDQLARTDFGADELNALVQANASSPLVILQQHPERHDAVSAAIKVVYRPWPGAGALGAVAAAEMVVEQMSARYDWFELEEPVEEVELGGLPAGTFGMMMTLALDDEREYLIAARQWIVPRQDHVFIVGVSAPADAPEDVLGALVRAIHSISITTERPH